MKILMKSMSYDKVCECKLQFTVAEPYFLALWKHGPLFIKPLQSK